MTAGVHESSSIGPYRLVQRLGEGGMGVVHLAVGPHDRAVAVKVLRPHVAADPDARLRLAREVATLRRIRHPRVAEVLDADVDAPTPYLVTRFVPGRTLDDAVRQDGPLPLPDVVRLGRQLAEALRSVHALSVVHRDVKPANVMMTDDGPVLIDFGIAHVADESRITVTGLVMGTPGYLSPEVVGGATVTPATDWWGWGGTLAYAATGRPPFGKGPIEVVLERVRRGDADLDGLDPRMCSVVTTALAADPQQRPPGDWLVGALEDVLQARPDMAVTVPHRVDGGPHAAVTVAHRVDGGPHPVDGARAAVTVPHRPAPTRVVQPQPVAPQPIAPLPIAQQPIAPQPIAQQPDRPAPAPRPGRLLVAALAAFAALTSVAPGAAVVALAGWMVLARTADRSALGLWRRRYHRGPRPGDVPVTVLAVPWRALLATFTSVFALLLPLLVAVSVAFLVGAALTPTHPVPLAFAGVVAALTAWSGPGGGSLRRGTEPAVRRLAARRGTRIGVLAFCALVALGALIVIGNGSPADFAPFEGGATPIGS